MSRIEVLKGFGEVAKRTLLKELFAKIAERQDLCVALGSAFGHTWDDEVGSRSYRVLFLSVSLASRPITSCLFCPDEQA